LYRIKKLKKTGQGSKGCRAVGRETDRERERRIIRPYLDFSDNYELLQLAAVFRDTLMLNVTSCNDFS
jgi:hypothetical protein